MQTGQTVVQHDLRVSRVEFRLCIDNFVVGWRRNACTATLRSVRTWLVTHPVRTIEFCSTARIMPLLGILTYQRRIRIRLDGGESLSLAVKDLELANCTGRGAL